MQSSGCSLNDQACLCRDVVLDKSFDACVSASCTVKEVLSMYLRKLRTSVGSEAYTQRTSSDSKFYEVSL